MRKPVLQVKWIKNSKTPTTTPDVKETEVEGKTAIIAHTFIRGARTVITGVGVYIILDTARQYIVAQANKV